MTLIVGIKCSNGIVIGADGAATMGTAAMPTAIQPYVKKLSVLHECVVCGVSGNVGVSQRLNGIVSDLYSTKAFAGMKIHGVMQKLREAFWNGCLGPEYQIATVAKQVNPVAAVLPQCGAVVAMPVDGTLSMIQFDGTGGPEAATKDLLFLAIGSGQSIADPFLAFLRRIFWQDHQPNLAEGQFAVWWTLHHAVKSAPHGIADPKQIIALEYVKGRAIAHELTEDDMREHEVAVSKIEAYLREYKEEKPTIAQIPTAPAGVSASKNLTAPD